MRVMLIAVLLGALGGVAWAQDAASPADRAAIRTVISAQLDSFRHDDAKAAFGLAAPSIQTMFGTPDHFLAMVRQGYPPVYRPRSVRFDELASEDGTLVQHVDLIGPDGSLATALYSMEHEADGSWRIAGCTLLHPQRLET